MPQRNYSGLAYARYVMAITATMTLAGCASTPSQPKTYQPDHSRAYNLATAGGLRQAKDYDIPKDQAESLTTTLLDISGNTAAFNTNYGLGLSLDKALGLSVLSFMFSPPSQMERNSLLGWVPSDVAGSREEAVRYLAEALYAASTETIEAAGYAYETEYRDKARRALFDPFIETKIAFVKDGKDCMVRYQLFNDEISEAEPVPTFVLKEATTGYRLYTGHEIRYPAFEAGCYEPDPDTILGLTSLISQRLPDSVYLYMAPIQNQETGAKTPPMVLDHGKPLLFRKPT